MVFVANTQNVGLFLILMKIEFCLQNHGRKLGLNVEITCFFIEVQLFSRTQNFHIYIDIIEKIPRTTI